VPGRERTDAALLASAADPSSAEAQLLQANGFAIVEQDEAARLRRMNLSRLVSSSTS